MLAMDLLAAYRADLAAWKDAMTLVADEAPAFKTFAEWKHDYESTGGDIRTRIGHDAPGLLSDITDVEVA